MHYPPHYTWCDQLHAPAAFPLQYLYDDPEVGLDSAVVNRKLPAPADNRTPIVQL
jgi:hypothetical protein